MPMKKLEPIVPKVLFHWLKGSRFHTEKSEQLVFRSDVSRSQSDNLNACFKKLYDLIVEAGRSSIKRETPLGQVIKVKKL